MNKTISNYIVKSLRYPQVIVLNLRHFVFIVHYFIATVTLLFVQPRTMVLVAFYYLYTF